MFLVAHVWLTAFLTLLAGLPHFRCQCPTENAQPISLSTPFPVGKCCAAGSCCPSSPERSDRSGEFVTASQTKRPCCCHATSEPNTSKDGRHSQLKSLTCNRTLTDVAPALPSSQQKASENLVVELLVSDFAPPSLDVSLQAGYSVSPWQSYSQPPPTDLVVTLQHFLI
jgi:hypothetical protein